MDDPNFVFGLGSMGFKDNSNKLWIDNENLLMPFLKQVNLEGLKSFLFLVFASFSRYDNFIIC